MSQASYLCECDTPAIPKDAPTELGRNYTQARLRVTQRPRRYGLGAYSPSWVSDSGVRTSTHGLHHFTCRGTLSPTIDDIPLTALLGAQLVPCGNRDRNCTLKRHSALRDFQSTDALRDGARDARTGNACTASMPWVWRTSHDAPGSKPLLPPILR